jgi:branched-chain amino acid transport system ATP-binding protein
MNKKAPTNYPDQPCLDQLWSRALPHGGGIFLGGSDITQLPIHERAPRGLALVPQEREIFPSLTVHENLVEALQPGPWTVARVYDLFPRVAERQRNYGNQLSGGEQQMLAIGRALVGNPKVILLDEPFEGLAPIIVDSLLAALRRIRNETQMAMMLIEQHAQLVLVLLPEAIILDRGQVRWSGQSETLRRSTSSPDWIVGLPLRSRQPHLRIFPGREPAPTMWPHEPAMSGIGLNGHDEAVR